jgi:hypothetical protein
MPVPIRRPRRLLESILAPEEEHVEDLVDLLEDLPKK